jgi:hypothetical protein
VIEHLDVITADLLGSSRYIAEHALVSPDEGRLAGRSVVRSVRPDDLLTVEGIDSVGSRS